MEPVGSFQVHRNLHNTVSCTLCSRYASNHTTGSHIPEGSNLKSSCCQNLRSHYKIHYNTGQTFWAVQVPPPHQYPTRAHIQSISLHSILKANSSWYCFNVPLIYVHFMYWLSLQLSKIAIYNKLLELQCEKRTLFDSFNTCGMLVKSAFCGGWHAIMNSKFVYIHLTVGIDLI